MLSFSLTGTIGCILATAPDELTLAISSVVSRAGKPDRVAWVLCIARDDALRQTISEHLREGDCVCLSGEIEQRRRQAGELVFYSVGFVIGSIDCSQSTTPSPSGESQ